MRRYFFKIYKDDKESLYNYIKTFIKNNEKKFIVTVNPEIIINSKNNKTIENLLLDKNNILVPDGISIVKSAKYFNVDIKERITGIDICNKLLDIANEEHKSIYLFGGKEKVINKMVNVIKDKYKNIIIKGYSNGYIKDKDKLFEKILNLKPDIVLVALGVPEQELLIYKHLNKFDKGIFVGVGGSFDVISGYKKRAPKIFIKLNLEWLYRIIKEPSRIKRFYNNNIKFLIEVRRSRKRRDSKNECL